MDLNTVYYHILCYLYVYFQKVSGPPESSSSSPYSSHTNLLKHEANNDTDDRYLTFYLRYVNLFLVIDVLQVWISMIHTIKGEKVSV